MFSLATAKQGKVLSHDHSTDSLMYLTPGGRQGDRGGGEPY